MTIRKTAQEFCSALDAGDWETVASLLAPGCEYACRGELYEGVETIVASYREIDEWVHRSFDSVRYESRIESCSEHEALISFRDVIEHGEHRLDFRCQQRIEVGNDGRILRILHIDLEGEPEKAAQFNWACGVRKLKE
ncbi:MAG: hypothetical protein DWQ01_10995 [Planctomycetota bacterium]|nr:MAG: hypothetical protein DWQ01_10995 [Planctomycetota bacterium]